MNRTTGIVLAILAVLTIAAGIGFAVIVSAAPAAIGVYLALVYMPTPLLSLVIAKYVFRRSLRILPPMPIWRAVLPNIGLVLAIVLSWLAVTLTLSALLAQVNPEVFGTFISTSDEAADRLYQLQGATFPPGADPPVWLLLLGMVVSGVLAGLTINAVVAFGEEALWRGYLVTALRRSFYVKYLTIGAIWGLWHAPINIQGYNYGPEFALPGAALFVVFCSAFGLLFGIVAERTGNVIYSAILHGIFNGIAAAVAFFVVSDNSLISGPVGLVSIAAMLVVFVIFRGIIRPRREGASTQAGVAR